MRGLVPSAFSEDEAEAAEEAAAAAAAAEEEEEEEKVWLGGDREVAPA